MRSMSLVMSEQQKIDETVESITNKDKKKNTKIVQSSTAFEEEQRFVAENEIDDQDGILDTKQWESKKNENTKLIVSIVIIKVNISMN